jgi:selenocysteine lyase/cysteine desulfurase
MPEVDRLIYLDNAATTYPKPECVYQAADKFYRLYGGNAGRGANPLARKSAELIAETRVMLSDWLGASSPERVILTPSATVALNLAILGAKLRHGDVVYATPFEHNSVLRPLEHLRQSVGVFINEIPFDRPTMACQLDSLAVQFRAEPPALVCITQASNVCGIMPPVLEIARLAKKTNPEAVVVVDGAQVAGLHLLLLGGSLVDAYIFSGHKSLHGPYGTAGLVLSSDWRPTPLLYGGTGTISESVKMPSDLPSAYEAGSHNVWAIAGLKAALKWLHASGRESIVSHKLDLACQLRDELENLPGIRMHVPSEVEAWCGVLSFAIEGIRSQSIEITLGSKGIAVRAGLHCAPWSHRWLGTVKNGGSVRVSLGFKSSLGDVKQLVNAISNIVGS